MTNVVRTDLSFILDEIAKLLDISDSLFEAAEAKYLAVGAWLAESNSPLASYSPEIYPQGSFLLGTVTRPLGDQDEYDIDLVSELNLSIHQETQKRLKNLVGDRLKDHARYRQMLDAEGRRCWTLNYADGARFHLDILPAAPNDDYRTGLKERGVPNSWAKTGIALTDRTLPNYEMVDPRWPRGNPKGYAAWFRSRMETQFDLQRKSLAEALKADIASVPDYRIKTPLQRVIQLLKRHRDVVFENKDDKPTSIVITTLAAHAYNNETDLVEALTNVISGMPHYIEIKNGIPWVQNPVDPLENFADRWQEHSEREQEFRQWLKAVREDLESVVRCEDVACVHELLQAMFGERVAGSAMARHKERRVKARTKDTGTTISIVRPSKPWG